MATGQEKFQIIFEAQDAASTKIRELTTRLNELGGPPLVKAQNEIKKLERQINQLSGEANKGHGVFSRFTQGIAIGTFTANIALQALSKGYQELKGLVTGTIDAAAESEKVWQQTTASLERHNLASRENIKTLGEFATRMQHLTGIADEEYLQTVQQMIDRGASFTQALQLTSAAVDVAASKHGDMGRVLREFTAAIGKGSLESLEKYGIVIQKTGTFSDQLNNAILQLTANVGGAASDAVNGYAVQINVLKQSFSDIQEKIGSVLLPILIEVAKTLTAFIDEFSRTTFGEEFAGQSEKVKNAGAGIITTLQQARENIHAWVEVVINGGKLVSNAFEIVVGAIRTVLAPILDLLIGTGATIVDVVKAVSSAVSGNFGEAWESLKTGFSDVTGAWSDAATSIQTEANSTSEDIDDLTFAFAKFTQGLAATTVPAKKAVETIKTTGADAAEKARAARARAEAEAANRKAALDKVLQAQQAFEDIQIESDDTLALVSNNALEQTSVIAGFVQSTLANISDAMSQSVSNWLGVFIRGRANLAQVFKGIASDFFNLFVKAVLDYVARVMVVRLVALLGGLFDNPTNDRMAAKQGADFAAHFQRGALGMLGNRTGLGASIAGQNRMTPVAQSSGGGMVVMNVTVAGNVLSDHYIEKIIKPKLQQLATDGKTFLSLNSEYKTGERNVRLN